MLNAEPDYPHVVLGFAYRGCRIQIDKGECNGQLTYAAWVDYPQGSAVAVPFAFGRAEAMRKAKRWVDARLAKSALAAPNQPQTPTTKSK